MPSPVRVSYAPMLPQPATSALARPTTRRRKVEAVQAWEQTKVAPRMPVQALMMGGGWVSYMVIVLPFWLVGCAT